MKKTIIIGIILLTGCNGTQVAENTTFESIEEYIDTIHAEPDDENKFFFQDGTANYSIEGYELVVDENGDPVAFENASFWIYAETGFESKADDLASFYLRGMEGPKDAVYGPFEGNLVEMLR